MTPPRHDSRPRATTRELLGNRVTLVWAGLIVATLIQWTLGETRGLPVRVAVVVVLAVAFLKVHFIGRYFMDLRRAPPLLQAIFAAWVAVIWLTLAVIFLLRP